MGWNDVQSGQFNGNRPDPNNTQATQDYNRGYSERIAADNAARAAQQASSIPVYTPPPAPTYSTPTYTPTPSYAPSTSTDFSFTPSTTISSGSSYSGGGRSRASMTEEETRALLYPDVAARREKDAQNAGKIYKTPWAAIFLGVIVGYGAAIFPAALSGNYYHSPYLDKMGLSLAIFCAFVFWAIVELTRGRGRAALATGLLGFFIPEVFWLGNGVTFLQAYSTAFTNALNHLAK